MAMQELLYNVVTAVLVVLAVKSGIALLGGPDPVRGRRLPVAAIALTALVVAGLLVQLLWSGAYDALDADPARAGWWRPLTSVFIQNGGVVGDAFNLVTIALVAALAEWCWGAAGMLLLFLAGMLAPHYLNLLVGLGGVSHQARNFAGSSGATYFLAATMAGALLLRATQWQHRLLALAVPVVGLVTFAVQDNAHGLVSAYGSGTGLVVAAGCAVLRTRSSAAAVAR